MPTYLISYDLMTPGQDYDELHDAIKSEGTWWHHLQSTWFVVSQKTSADLRSKLNSHIDSNDKIIVVNVTGDGWAAMGFPQEAYDWLKANM